mgnify:CR=1
MAELKTKATNQNPKDFLNKIEPEEEKQEASEQYWNKLMSLVNKLPDRLFLGLMTAPLMLLIGLCVVAIVFSLFVIILSQIL